MLSKEQKISKVLDLASCEWLRATAFQRLCWCSEERIDKLLIEATYPPQ